MSCNLFRDLWCVSKITSYPPRGLFVWIFFSFMTPSRQHDSTKWYNFVCQLKQMAEVTTYPLLVKNILI